MDRRTLTDPITTALALVFLHLAIAIFYWLAAPAPATLLAPTWEILGLVGVLLLVGWIGTVVQIRGLDSVLTVLVLAYFVLGLAQGFARREFGYDVIVALHAPYVPELFRMLYNGETLGMFLLYCALLAVVLIALLAGIYAAVRKLVQQSASTRRSRLLIGGGVAVYAAITIPLFGIQGPLTKNLIEQVDLAVNLDQRIDETARRIELETAWIKQRNPFAKLDKPPRILLFIIESYGRALYDDEDFANFQKLAQASADKLAEGGYAVRSRYLTAPVFGGSSWLSDTALLCGVRIPDQKHFRGMHASHAKCLPHILDDAGYHTVVAAPNTKTLDGTFDEGLGFETIYYRENLAYQGPRFGWSFMPDQYAIQRVHEDVLAKGGERPEFVTYILTSSHHPWNKLPPLIDQWDEIGDGAIFSKRRPRRFSNSFVGGRQVKKAFMASIEYSFETVIEYLLRLDDRETIIVITGDHQPRTPIADLNTDPWDVPFHIISRNPALVERFASAGYEATLEPRSDAPAQGSEGFLLQLFRAFSDADTNRR
ncbi:sulfatase-like hydrolase/transferase [Haliangium ochraceum]|uniref:Sulfatase n=1 Tax=Haliangium ochraceum (strain DSM 14365 / JCM 11303 / SMP-2) TaxID=502025 RepID=D0LLG5_HALO1|nr:sulfatase-like hydrolase/transferase [Haliangium ochraceum]ACY13182.1 sulfatase [Haliangium ochraceum DSM 14365]